ncbi:AsmA-like C-terminal region-containing protein [Acidicapsa acidisoli]|uniref:AsmA-like C-terminal region-containing protein n=1 Tax=Acidicapsa acidisoli TaxID=1615681 RepID=UPI0021E04136|nr:AsmA-like C-terminal region-containing protein [Acidicapsa acidisoli]
MANTEDGATGNREQSEKVAPSQPKRRLSRLARWLLWIGAALLILGAAVAGTVAFLFHRAEPILRARLIDTLEQRFHAKVDLGDLRVSILDGFWVEGHELRIWLPAEAVATEDASAGQTEQAPWRTEPWIVVKELRFHASWHMRPGKPIEISGVHVEGVRVLLPPKQDRPHLGQSQSTPEAPATGSAGTPQSNAVQPPSSGTSLIPMPRVIVRKIECQDATLVIERNPEPGKPPKVPLEFDFAHMTLIPDEQSGRIAFTVDMTNPKPVGTIRSTGYAGPWTPSDPGELPVEGDYHFDHADLSTIKGIAGILSSTGHYTGTLRKIEADGQTETPDFRLERVAKETGVPLTTHFHAIVDGTNGDTWLQPVEATLGHTHFVARGQVVRATGAGRDVLSSGHGHDIRLQVTVDRGRIEDILHISEDAQTVFMTGGLTLETSFHLPPNPPSGDVTIWDRLRMDGEFHLSQARFNNDKMQGRIEQLSLRGQGKPHEVKTTDPTSVLSDMHGHFKLADGTLQLPDLEYQVPGAKILAHGAYGLQGGTLSFEGDARMDATLSEMVGGWKGFLLKPADRYLKKNGAGTDVPIHVSGTRKDPEFGVEFNRLGKRDDTAQP